MKTNVNKIDNALNRDNTFAEVIEAAKLCYNNNYESILKNIFAIRARNFVNKTRYKKYDKIRDRIIPFESVITIDKSKYVICGCWTESVGYKRGGKNTYVVLFNIKTKKLNDFLKFNDVIKHVNY